MKCGRRFTTYEYVERMPLMVIKRDGRREPYDRQKVVNGIVLACRKRPVGRQEIEQVVEAVETRLEEQGRVEVSSAEIGELVLEQLIKIDPVAYVRFASVYRQFTSPEQFVEELKKFKKEARGGQKPQGQ